MSTSTMKDKNLPTRRSRASRAIIKDKYHAKFERLKWGCRDRVISKTTTSRKKIFDQPSSWTVNHTRRLIMQAINGAALATKILGQICECGFLNRKKDFTFCPYCTKLEVDSMTGLPKLMILNSCNNCGKYYTPSFRGSGIVGPPHSPELLTLLIKMLGPHLLNRKAQLLHFQYVQSEPISKSCIKLSVTVQVETPAGEKLEKTCIVEYLLKFQECRLCWLMGPMQLWNFVVQLRPYVASSKGAMESIKSLEPSVLGLVQIMPAVNLRKVGRGFDVFFLKDMHANSFLNGVSGFTLVKYTKMNMKDKPSQSQSCIPAYVCPICSNDLVFLPQNVSAKLGNFGPLVICIRIISLGLMFVDPFTLSECTLNGDEYWKAPFDPLKTQNELVEFVVLHVEVIPRKANYSSDEAISRKVGIPRKPRYTLANIEVARVSDFGNNDLRFSVKSHLGNVLKPGDYALGYMLYGANITDIEAEKCRDALPDVVLIEKRKEDEPVKKIEMKKNVNPEYMKFLRELEDNPEAIFDLSLNNKDEDGDSAMS